jgi:hypothetical protein
MLQCLAVSSLCLALTIVYLHFFLIVKRTLTFCFVYSIAVFYDVSLVVDDSHSAVFISFYDTHVAVSLFSLFPSLFSVQAMFVYVLFALGYTYVSWYPTSSS